MQTVESSRSLSSDDAILRVIVDRLVSIYHPENIYLFGSAARGDAGPDSDYDLMIIVPNGTPPELRDPAPAYRAVWRLGAAIDPVVWTRRQFDKRLHLRASLPATVRREGKLLYAA
jgi:predicted nucleotidyltransferase